MADMTLTIAVSSRALFDLEKDAHYFNKHGLSSYIQYQRENEKNPFGVGAAFPLVKALLSLNEQSDIPFIEVVIVSSQHPDTGIRVMESVRYHGLPITRAIFAGGHDATVYLNALKTDMFLTCSRKDAEKAINMNIASAVMYPAPKDFQEQEMLKIAFDGDAVLFSDESETIYKASGLKEFAQHELTNANLPMGDGPFSKILRTLHAIKTLFPNTIRIALVTARNAPAHERALKTLRMWKVDVDEAFFLGGMKKEPFIHAFNPHIFFDDQDIHLRDTAIRIPVARVPCSLHAPVRDTSP